MSELEFVKGFKEAIAAGNPYDFTCNNYWKTDSKALADIICELIVAIEDGASIDRKDIYSQLNGGLTDVIAYYEEE